MKNRKRKKPNYLKIGTKVYTHVSKSPDSGNLFLCEAKIIRQPNFFNGPYKLLISGIQLPNAEYVPPKNLLGLKLRRKQDAIMKQLNAFCHYENEKWVYLSDQECNDLFNRAIANIQKEKVNQSKSKKSWLHNR